MGEFLRIYCTFAFPVFAFVALRIWRPDYPSRSERFVADRIAWTVIALGSCLIFNVFAFPLVVYAALRIWRPGWLANIGRSIADRIAWTVFAFGISLMFNMALYAAASESDGDFRSWATIRLHGRVFFALALIPVAGPLIVFLYQVVRTHHARSTDKKVPDDDSAIRNL